MRDLSFSLGSFKVLVAIDATSTHLRVGRYDVFITRETAPCPVMVERLQPGEIAVYLRGRTVALMNHRRCEAAPLAQAV